MDPSLANLPMAKRLANGQEAIQATAKFMTG
jgi:hypothetical protein